MKRRAIFMDRDGTISEEVGYVNHLSRYKVMPDSLEAIRLVNRAGLLAIVTTNQSGVARGYFSESLIHDVHARLRSLVQNAGACLDAIYYCPHHPQEGAPPYRAECECRKPRPGMILKAAVEHDIDLAGSYVVGDSTIDMEAGAAAGVPGVLVLTGYGRGLVEHQAERFKVRPVHTTENLLAAVRWILARDSEEGRAAASGIRREP